MCGVEVSEGWAVEGAEVSGDAVFEDGIDLPAGVVDVVLRGASVAAFGEAPVVFRDELFHAVWSDGLRLRDGLDRERMPGAAVLPVVLDGERLWAIEDAVAGWQGGVRLLVKGVRDEGDGGARDELGDEDDAAALGTVGFGTADVEAEIYLLEAGVERDGEALEANAIEEKADEGDVAGVLVEIEFDAAWEPGGEQNGVDGVLGHDELAPFGGKEGAGHG